MTKSELNQELNTICSELFAGADLRELREESEAVRRRYRDKSAKGQALEIRGHSEAQAYLAWRFPVTAMVIHDVMLRLAEADPAFAPRTVLDLGAGPAVSVLPVTQVFPAVKDYTLVEEQSAMARAGTLMLEKTALHLPKDLAISWIEADFLKGGLPAADLVLASYAVNELNSQEARRFCAQLSEIVVGSLVLIVPGTPEHFQQLLSIRNELLTMGWSIQAPCTFTGACPMEDEPDWCHFYARVSRSSLLRQIKSAQLAYEDEKFSYLIARPVRTIPAEDHMARIIRHPRISKGYREVTLCHRHGITMARFTKGRHKEVYAQLKKKGWGDLLEMPLHSND